MSPLALAVLGLLVPVLLGAFAGATKRMRDPEGAIDALNVYALRFGFPALITRGLMTTEAGLPSDPGFWLLVPLVYAACLAVVWLTARKVAGTLALILGFGNVAYLGLPLVQAALGDDALALAAVAVPLHLVIGLSIGPALLVRFGGGEGAMRWRPILTQPLLWAPFVGALLRVLPEDAKVLLEALLAPVAKSAGPVALFLLGLYLHRHRDRARRIDGWDLVHVVMKLALMPALTLGLAWAFVRAGWLEASAAQVLVLLAMMPAAITTFSLAHDLDVGTTRVGRAIVTTSLLSAGVIPLGVWIARSWVAGW
ncbi:MAG: AEC family transporter [Myxococcota bacterium]